MVEETKTTGTYSTSDKLAIALACLAGVMAIILFLVEKTPLTVIVLLALMVVLSIYPIFHFAKSNAIRILLILTVMVGTSIFGWRVWPGGQVAASQQQNPPKGTGGNVQQHSEGPNSPNTNVIGNHNVVNIGDPKVAARLDEITRLLKARGDEASPKTLLSKYPLGYVIFDVDYQNSVFPYKTRALDDWNIDFSNVVLTEKPPPELPGMVQVPTGFVLIRLPAFRFKDGTPLFNNYVAEPKKIGPFKQPLFRYTHHFDMSGEILAIRKDGIVFVVGLTPSKD